MGAQKRLYFLRKATCPSSCWYPFMAAPEKTPWAYGSLVSDTSCNMKTLQRVVNWALKTVITPSLTGGRAWHLRSSLHCRVLEVLPERPVAHTPLRPKILHDTTRFHGNTHNDETKTCILHSMMTGCFHESIVVFLSCTMYPRFLLPSSPPTFHH